MDSRVSTPIFHFLIALLDEEINPKADFATLLIRIAKLNALPQPLKYKIGQIFVDYLYHHKVILPEEKHKVFIVFLLFFLFRATTDRDSLNPFDGIIYDLINKPSYTEALESPKVKDAKSQKILPRAIEPWALSPFPTFSVSERNFFIRLFLCPENRLCSLLSETTVEDVTKERSNVELLDVSSISGDVTFKTRQMYTFSNCPVAPSFMSEFMEPKEYRLFYLKSIFQETFANANVNMIPSKSATPASISVINSSHVQSKWETNPEASTSQESGAFAEAESLLTKCLSQTLNMPSQTMLLEQLARYPVLPFRVELTPTNYAELVENNPLIAGEVLLIFIKAAKTGQTYYHDGRAYQISKEMVNEYISRLHSMDISVHSMEVINQLSSKVDLPPKFVSNYIRKSILSCENIKDVYVQNRLVRLLCVFIRYFILNNRFNVQSICIELKTFCVQFARIREASTLYRMLHQNYGNGTE